MNTESTGARSVDAEGYVSAHERAQSVLVSLLPPLELILALGWLLDRLSVASAASLVVLRIFGRS